MHTLSYLCGISNENFIVEIRLQPLVTENSIIYIFVHPSERSRNMQIIIHNLLIKIWKYNAILLLQNSEINTKPTFHIVFRFWSYQSQKNFRVLFMPCTVLYIYSINDLKSWVFIGNSSAISTCRHQ